jgi:hypothetical protein
MRWVERKQAEADGSLQAIRFAKSNALKVFLIEIVNSRHQHGCVGKCGIYPSIMEGFLIA